MDFIFQADRTAHWYGPTVNDVFPLSSHVQSEFNKYFVSVFKDKSNIPLPSQKYFPVPGEQEELTDLHFTEVHVFKEVTQDRQGTGSRQYFSKTVGNYS